MRSMNSTVGKNKWKDSLFNLLAIAMKIIKFCVPGNDPQHFLWSHMTCEKLNRMTLALNNDVELKPTSITNYWKTVKTMLREGVCREPQQRDMQTIELGQEAPERAECGKQ